MPLIALAEKSARALRDDMVTTAHSRGFTELQPLHNPVFATLPPEGARAVDMAHRAGITRQSMGEAIRDLAAHGIVEMVPDPADGRAKIVMFTEYGRKVASSGYSHIIEIDALVREKFGDRDVDATYRVLQGVMELLAEE
ncbi:MarR family winged helix-turn-helix transcriptional regulator [Nocardioides marmorisolisilvae]|uniref:MarR family winged helix-turn-helix transcriptional regulator n=1 Tax=Nocardioides marmorisolisilvae TaxID=1542737 RepID=UPI00161A3DDE|nr:MarR family winged helix-turn-helix transcriptional regulator [Nocardioides marmorisolisilvae]